MADVITRLRLESGEFDNKIKRATQGMLAMERECRKVGGTMAVLEKDQLQYVQSLGRMQTTATTTKGKIAELTQAYTEFSMLYKRMSQEERNSPTGKALIASLDQLKQRLNDTKKGLADVNKELGGGFNSALGSVASKLGINSELTGLITTGTLTMTAAITAGAAAVVAATKAWADYNAELSKQDQITSVTTGLSGAEANRMTDAVRAMAQVYNVDFREAINAANTLMTQFGVSGDEALQLLRDGMQGMIMGDGPKLLQMIQKFAATFNDAGISASQLVAIIQNSEGGIFTDQNMDAIAMGIKKVREMTANMSKDMSETFKKVGINGEEMASQLNNGSITIFEALQKIANALQTVGSGSKEAGVIMKEVFGRQGSMAGTKLGEAIATLNTNLDETKTQTGELGQSFADLEKSTERLNTALRDCFGYDGYQEMANGIKAELVGALTEVINGLAVVRKGIEAMGSAFGDFGANAITILGKVASNISTLISPLNSVINLLRKLGSSSLTDSLTDYVNNLIMNAGGNATGGGEGGGVRGNNVIEPSRSRTGGGRRGGGGRTTTQAPPPAGSILAQEAEVKKLTDAWKNATDQAGRDGYLKQLEEAKKVLDEMQGKVKKEEPIKLPELADFGTHGGASSLADTINAEIAAAAQMLDETTLRNLMTVQMQNALEGIDFTTVQERMVEGFNITDEEWQAIVDDINSKLAELGIEPIQLNFKTGKIDELEDGGKSVKESWSEAASAIGTVSGALASIKNPGAQIAATIGQAIATIAQAYAENLAEDGTTKGNIWAFIAASAAAVTSMITTISAVKSNAHYAEGGIIGGKSFSGDNQILPVNVNAGELILNRAQAGIVADAISGNNAFDNIRLESRIAGEDIIVALTNSNNRRFKGSYVMSKRG